MTLPSNKDMNEFYSLHQGHSPLIISIPHLGTEIPNSLRHTYTSAALDVADTDWHLDKLYGFARNLGATILGGQFSRYVVDLNRPPNDENLYPGQTTTGLFPTETFRGEPIYRDRLAPNAREKRQRIDRYWRPYHETLAREIVRLRAIHPHVLVWEAHSIASILPRLFESKLPDLNIGTQDERTAAREIQYAVEAIATKSQYSGVANGRFKGGFITRNFGAPQYGIHALQLEMCQSTYMNEESPFDYIPERAQGIAPTLMKMMEAALTAMLALPVT